MAPDVARISRHITTNCFKQPILLNEFCRFILYPPSSFLSQTSQYFLPDLVIKCASEELNTIARILETTVTALIVEKPAEIFEQVFMLENIAATEKALDFILQNLQSVNVSSQRSLGIPNLVKIALLPLLGRLVIQLGDPGNRRDVVITILFDAGFKTDASRPFPLFEKWRSIPRTPVIVGKSRLPLWLRTFFLGHIFWEWSPI